MRKFIVKDLPARAIHTALERLHGVTVNGSGVFFRLRVSAKPILDKIDQVLAAHYGFMDEELDFIPSTKLRQASTMTSSIGWDETQNLTTSEPHGCNRVALHYSDCQSAFDIAARHSLPHSGRAGGERNWAKSHLPRLSNKREYINDAT